MENFELCDFSNCVHHFVSHSFLFIVIGCDKALKANLQKSFAIRMSLVYIQM